MRTVDFNVILFEALQVAGQDRQNIQQSTFAQFRDFANSRMRYMWDAFEWPEAIKIQELSITTENGVLSAAAPSDSEELLRVFNNNPLSQTNNKEHTFTIYFNTSGIRRLAFPAGVGSAFLIYKSTKPVFYGDSWIPSIPYSIGAQAYFDIGANKGGYMPTAGKPCTANFYTCIDPAAPGESPATHPAKWKKVEIPYFAASYLPRAMHSDWLRSEMQFDLAQAVEQEAEFALTEEIGKVTKIQGQSQRLNIINLY